jgi:hypothetical protein
MLLSFAIRLLIGSSGSRMVLISLHDSTSKSTFRLRQMKQSPLSELGERHGELSSHSHDIIGSSNRSNYGTNPHGWFCYIAAKHK